MMNALTFEHTEDRQTKIVATLGPASSTEKMIEKLVNAGVNVFRLNFSHGTHKEHQARVTMIRTIEKNSGKPIGIIADMQGPKLRVGKFKDGSIKLKKGMEIRLDLDETQGDETRVNLPHPEIIKVLDKGDTVLLDDGKVRMEIVKKGKDYLTARVLAGTNLSDHKGLNVPGVVLPIPALTAKDRKDLDAALKMGADWIAMSFVQKPEDVAEGRKLIGRKAGLMIKLEKPSALDHLDEMIDLSDAVMLARGDLGVEIPPEDVPAVQKRVVRKVRFTGKPIIVATQMLESMIESPAPTRAEASDVATAVYDGADAVMLSAETAAGKYPLEAVGIMNRVCQSTEHDEGYRRHIAADIPDGDSDSSDAITTAAYFVARSINAACIVNYTTSGSTALRTARLRPMRPIMCLTQNESVARKLCLSYGVWPVHVTDVQDTGGAVQRASEIALRTKIAKQGDRFVLTAGVPFGTPGSTNVLRVAWVK